MKYIKTYETIEDELQIGDFVICKEKENSYTYSIYSQDDYEKLQYFLENNIGLIKKKGKRATSQPYYKVFYDYLPDNIKQYFSPKNLRPIYKEEILYHSSNKEDIEQILNAKKYNL